MDAGSVEACGGGDSLRWDGRWMDLRGLEAGSPDPLKTVLYPQEWKRSNTISQAFVLIPQRNRLSSISIFHIQKVFFETMSSISITIIVSRSVR